MFSRPVTSNRKSECRRGAANRRTKRYGRLALALTGSRSAAGNASLAVDTVGGSLSARREVREPRCRGSRISLGLAGDQNRNRDSSLSECVFVGVPLHFLGWPESDLVLVGSDSVLVGSVLVLVGSEPSPAVGPPDW